MNQPAVQHPVVPRSILLAMLLQYGIGGAVMPFAVLFFRDRGLNITEISRIYAIFSALLLFFPFLWGMLADRFIPLNRMFIGLNILIAAFLLVLSRQTTYASLLIGFVAFAVCFNPSLILLNPICFHHLENPRTQFGRLRSWGSMGWMIPSLFIYVWLAAVPGNNLAFTLYFGTGLALAMAVVAFWLPHLPPGAVHVGPEHPAGFSYFASVRKLLANGGYVTALTVYFLVASSYNIQANYFSPLLEDVGLARKWIGPSQCVGVVVEVILFRWQTRLLSRLSISNTILIGVGAMIIRQLVLTFADAPWILIASHALTGVVIVYHHIGISVLINAIAPTQVRSTSQTMMILFGSGVGPLLANVAIGWISEATGQNLRMVFLFATCLATLGGLLLALRSKHLNSAIT